MVDAKDNSAKYKPKKLRVGRPRTFTAQALKAAVEKYFNSISRDRIVTEEVCTGETDKYGHAIYLPVPVKTDDGKPLMERQFLLPPTVGGLCRHLGIHRSTWADWCNAAEHPEYQQITEWARDVMQDYLESELLKRSGRDVRGVEFALQANYGASGKTTVELGPRAAASLAGLDMSKLTDDDLKAIAMRNMTQEDT